MKLAMWLLRTFDVPQRNDALIGDLAEERAAGRSLVWLWAQMFAAIANTVARDLRDHWVLAFRAIVTGWVASCLISWQVLDRLPIFFWPDFVTGTFDLLIWPMVLGWIVAETHRTKRAAMVLAFAASVVLCSPWGSVLTIDSYGFGDGHWPNMISPHVPDGFFDSLVGCSAVVGILIGGLLLRLRKSAAS